MMKLFRYDCGDDTSYGVAEDLDDAYRRRAEVDKTFAFVLANITEVTVPGYEITVTPIEQQDEFDQMERDELKAYLDGLGIEYTANWGEKRLRELCRNANKGDDE